MNLSMNKALSTPPMFRPRVRKSRSLKDFESMEHFKIDEVNDDSSNFDQNGAQNVDRMIENLDKKKAKGKNDLVIEYDDEDEEDESEDDSEDEEDESV